jgi:hypothetical protein
MGRGSTKSPHRKIGRRRRLSLMAAYATVDEYIAAPQAREIEPAA